VSGKESSADGLDIDTASGRSAKRDNSRPPSRTKWTRRVLHLVLIGHAASFTSCPAHPEAGGAKLCVCHQRNPRRVREQKEQVRPAVGLEHPARQTHGRRTRPGSVAAALLGRQTRRRRRRCSGQVDTERAHGVMHACPVRDVPLRTKWTRRVPDPVLIGHAASLRDDPHRGLLQRRLCRCRAVSGKRPRECWVARARLRAQRPRSSREPRPPLALAPRAPARPETARCRALGPAASLPRRRHGSAALLSRIRPGRYTPTGRAALPPLPAPRPPALAPLPADPASSPSPSPPPRRRSAEAAAAAPPAAAAAASGGWAS